MVFAPVGDVVDDQLEPGVEEGGWWNIARVQSFVDSHIQSPDHRATCAIFRTEGEEAVVLCEDGPYRKGEGLSRKFRYRPSHHLTIRGPEYELELTC